MISPSTKRRKPPTHPPPRRASLAPQITGLMVIAIRLIPIENEYKMQVCEDLIHDNPNHDYYFGSYSHSHIHEEMLKDTVRTIAY